MHLRGFFGRYGGALPIYRRYRLRRIDEYLDRLRAAAVPSESDVSQAHVARLEFAKDPETRLRSIQTLAAIGDPRTLPYALEELLSYAHSTQRVPAGAYALLADVISETLHRLSEFEQTHPIRSRGGEPTGSDQTTAADFRAYLVPLSLGLPNEHFRLPRFVALNVYLRTTSYLPLEQVNAAVEAFCEYLGFAVTDSFPATTGSWYKKWFAKTKEALTQQEVSERLKRGERALELAVLHKQQAVVDREQAEAAAALIASLSTIPNAACQIGSILVIKLTDMTGRTRLFTRTLTPDQMIELERHPKLLGDPESILEKLDTAFRSPLAESPSGDDGGLTSV